MSGQYIDGTSGSPLIRGNKIKRVPKEWGEEQWIVNKEYCGKKLLLKKDRRCSLHEHRKKDEVFYLESGKVQLELQGKTFILEPGDFVHIPTGADHRFTGLLDSVIFEFSSTHDEADSYRKEFSGHVDPERFRRQQGIINKFSKLSVVVLGDIMLDSYIQGSVARVSPEAPVPIVHAHSTKEVPGGSANSAANLKALGAGVTLLGVVGSDDAGALLKDLLTADKIRTELIVDKDRPTTVKQRIVSSGGHQIVRIDHEDRSPISVAFEKKLLVLLKKHLAKADALLISDYAKGVLTPSLLKSAIALARAKKIPVVVDPKPPYTTLSSLTGATAITPNVKEAHLLLQDDRMTVEKVGAALSKKLKGAVILTRSEAGADVYEGSKKTAHFASHAPDVVDVTGAGDTVAALVALSLAAGASISDAADLGNRAAGVVVRKHGASTLTQEELMGAL